MAIGPYTEADFETHIEAHLLASGYESRTDATYDATLCLIPQDLLAFVQATQPEEFEKLQAQYGAGAAEQLSRRVAREIERRGLLHVLRNPVKDRGAHVRLVYFKPRSGMNPLHEERYAKNIFSVVRQHHFSASNNKSLDLTLFLNGLPIITMELKNPSTGQTVEDAKKQYQKDRSTREPLFKFKRCLVHFAVDPDSVFMTTRLTGASTRFFPFNKDAVNPIHPTGHRTHYLWEEILQPDTLLDLIENYLHLQQETVREYDPKKHDFIEREKEALIFPRYHQFEVVGRLLETVREEGPGHSYLIQHSAGSGKSNSIGWLAHQLAALFKSETDTTRVFDSIIVITDRRVLDRQLQHTLKQLEQVDGVVRKIDKDSQQLKQALETGKDIVVTTLQKFPVISGHMETLKGKHFAVIVDEAHSSQSGESSKHLKKVLSANLEDAEDAESETGAAMDPEDHVVDEIRARGRQTHISYFAFTATPKNKTLELFGRQDAQGRYVPFHSYTMRQAIAERFILDVLKNYTTFKRYFQLTKATEADTEYERKKTVRVLTRYVDLHPHAIEHKTGIMLDHFEEVTRHAIQGKGRAMLVTRSRLHAVRYGLEFKKQLAERGSDYVPLIAFSGTVRDPDTGYEYTEAGINPLRPGTDIKEGLKMPAHRILIVANKFQTGFDEPLLHTMWVDKKLRGVQAVQTLSRLNRARAGKTDTVVLDFVNEAAEIQEAFQPFYQTTLLDEATDPNKLYDLQTEIEAFGLYTAAEFDRFAELYFDPSIQGELYLSLLNDVKDRWLDRSETEQEDVRTLLQRYTRLYSYVSQLISFVDPELEKLYAFCASLNRLLPKRKGALPYEVLDQVDLESLRVQETYKGWINLDPDEEGTLRGIPSGERTGPAEDEMDLLSNIVKVINEVYGHEVTDDQQEDLGKVRDKIMTHSGLREAAQADNTIESVRQRFDSVLDDLILEFTNSRIDLYKLLTKQDVNEMLKRDWFRAFYKRVGEE